MLKKNPQPESADLHSSNWAEIVKLFMVLIGVVAIGVMVLIALRYNELKHLFNYIPVYMAGVGTPLILSKSIERINKLMKD